jgi:hypothetical protein
MRLTNAYNFFRLFRFWGFVVSGAIFSVPFWVPRFKTEVSEHAVWFWAIGLVLCFFVIYWHTFSLFDNLDQKTKRRIEVSKPNSVDNRHGLNRTYQIDVINISSTDIHRCRAILRQIDRNEKPVWGGQDAALTFQPAEDDDALDKTIRPGREPHLDILRLEFVPFPHVQSATAAIAYQNWDTHFGTVRVRPCTKDGKWIFHETVEEIFSEKTDYFLTLEIGADETPTELVKLKFHYDNDESTLEILDQRAKHPGKR